jgi:hypothetical protein
MAQTGYTPIQLYRTTTAAATPSAANLSPGELAINIADTDMALYAENASGAVKRLMNNPAGLKYPTADGTSGQIIKTDGAGNLSFISGVSLATPVAVVGNNSSGSEIRLPEDTDNGSNYVAVKSPDSLAANYTCTLPDETCTLGFRNIPQNSQSTAYTLVLSDSGKHILHPSSDTTARVFTIPANSSVPYPLGTAITFINQNGAGTITISITSDTMRLAGPGTTGSRTLAANGIATAIKIGTTEWLISGNNLS